MTTIERSIFVEAAPEAVTAVTENANRFLEWFTGVVEKLEVVGDWPTVGSVVQMHMKSPGLTFKLTFTSSDGAERQAMAMLVAERAKEISIEQSLNNLKAFLLFYD